VPGVAVVTGYIAKDRAGNITTLGRNGSDYSAALFGAALGAEEIQIWTDVDGVMTADPRIVPTARPIAAMSLDEASELAYYGGKVLHPATIQPAMEKSIPVRVLNTRRPQSPGTVILPSFEEPDVVVRSIVHKQGIHMVTVTTPRMLQQSGYLARVFQACAEHAVDVDLVATSEVSVTMTTDRGEPLEPLRADLGRLGTVTIEDRQSIVCVVGQGIARAVGVPGQVFSALADAGVRVRVISQGAIKVNIAMVVADADAPRAVRALHARFFGS
jgi:aspartate kinase